MQGGSKKNEARSHSRIPMRLKVSLIMSEDGEMLAVTRDISDGGLFVLLDSEKMPEIGKSVNVQVQGLPNSMEAPWVAMEIVRIETDGIGLMILK